MKRSLYTVLQLWKDDPFRLPLIVDGARQVGKSYAVEHFGAQTFNNVAVVNFEVNTRFSSCFAELDSTAIIKNLEILLKQNIECGKTLLFLDEIQVCPRAIKSLRYFKEQLPELHVIAAGSLLDFTLHREKFSFPVGRVQFVYMRPLSFVEFLRARGEIQVSEMISMTTLDNKLTPPVHEHLLQLVREYFFLGGMPAIVAAYNREHSLLKCQQLQSSLITTYQADFNKYATDAQQKYLRTFFERSPQLVARQFQYKKIDPNTRSRELKGALEQLCLAGLLHRVHETSANGIPLRMEKKFKLLFLDIGLYQRALQVDLRQYNETDLLALHEGCLAEQFVGQELLAYANVFEDKYLYYWERSKKNSSAEVDFVVNIDANIVPIEVKAGKTGRLRSLAQFLQEKKCSIGVRISQAPLHYEHNILSIPFYLISQLPRLLCIQ